MSDSSTVTSIIGAVGSVASAGIAAWITVKVKEVHKLTNSRLGSIEKQLKAMTAERNKLQRSADLATIPEEQNE